MKDIPVIIGLTGGIGSGKSTVRNIFEKLGVPSIDADSVARSIHQDSKNPATQQIVNEFPSVGTINGALSIEALRELITINPDANVRLKSILKPAVMSIIEKWAKEQSTPYVLMESALIIEEGIPCERLIVVDAIDDVRIERIQKRNPNWAANSIKNMMNIQLPRKTYMLCASDVIYNNGNVEDLDEKVKDLHLKISAHYAAPKNRVPKL